MGRIELTLILDSFDENHQRVVVPDGKELEEIVNEDIERFQVWFCEHVDKEAVALTGPEIAILKTYLWYKTHPGVVPNG